MVTNDSAQIEIVVRTNDKGFLTACSVIVQQDAASTGSLSLSETKKKIEVGGSFEIEADLSSIGTDTQVNWSVINSEDKKYIEIERIGNHTAKVVGLDSTKGNYVLCKAETQVNGTVVSEIFSVEVVPVIEGARIKASPSSIISVGETIRLDLVLDTLETSFTSFFRQRLPGFRLGRLML